MITAKAQKNLAEAKDYFRAHLAQGDYYSEGQKVTSWWFGTGVERLGLDPNAPVTATQFERLCDNQHPTTGEQLTVRRRVQNHRVFYDFTASAPKSVSVMAVTIGDARIIAAHDAASREAMREMEKFAEVRVRRAGQQHQRRTGEFVAAMFQHDASRALDPQLHTHFVIFNATWDAVENRWKALEPRAMYDRINYFTEVYRNALARSLRELGYELRNTAHGFEIAGVSQSIIERYSKRRRAILAAEPAAIEAVNRKLREELEQAVRASAGQPPEVRALAERALREFQPVTQLSNEGRATLAHTTRQWKDSNLDPGEVLAYQRSQLSAGELAELLRLTQPGQKPAPEATSEPISATQAIDYARDHLFERNSVVPITEVLSEALAFSLGRLDLPELEAELANRNDFLEVEEMLTTRETLAQEQRMIELVNAGVNQFEPLNPSFAAQPSLSAEQRQAAEFILNSTDQVVGLRGGAGTGKTTLLMEVLRGIEARRPTIVLAPTTAAVEALRQSGCARAATIQRFLQDEEFQQDSADKVIVVDESGLLSRRDMLELLELRRRHSGRLILCGDTRQHTGIEAGDALRLLERRSALRTTGIATIRRQVNREYREAIAELAKGQGLRALTRLERIGALVEVAGVERYRRLAEEYLSSVKANKSALVVSPTWREIEQATDEIRQRLKKEEMLAPEDQTMVIHQSMKWTRAQKRDLRNYFPGLVLNFHRATAHFASGASAVVLEVQGDALVVKRGNDQPVQLTKKQADCFEVMEKKELPVALGERLLLQGNQKAAKLFNGQIVTVKEIRPDGGLLLTDERVIPPTFKRFTHGYCVTSHASQGRTVDHVFVAMDSQSFQAANRNQFYVSASRGREQVKIFTDAVDVLRSMVTKPGARLSAIELLGGPRRELKESTCQEKTVKMSVGA